MQTNHSLIYLLVLSLTTGCAGGPTYKPAPSAKSNTQYKREQIASPVGKQVGGAVMSGVVGGLLGPLGIIITSIGSNRTQKITMTHYWKSFSNTELVGVIVEDVTKKRVSEYLSNRSWFKDLPKKDEMPMHFSVDVGSGNILMLPVSSDLTTMPQVGDVVEVYAPPHAWHLVSPKAPFSALPVITTIRCEAANLACVLDPDNEPGIIKRLGEPSQE